MLYSCKICYSQRIVAETEEKLQHNVNEYQKELSAINLEININKSKAVIMANDIKERKIKIKGQLLEQVKSYRYLGTLTEYNGKVNEEMSEETGKVGRRKRIVDVKRVSKSKVKATEVRFLGRTKGITRRDRMRNTAEVEELNMPPTEKVAEERQLSLVGRVHRMNEQRLAKKIFVVRRSRENKVRRPQRR